MLRRRAHLLAVLVACALTLTACGDDDDDSGVSTTASPDPARYCELSRELDEAGSEEFEALENDPDATREDFEAAERSLVEANEDALNEIQAVAPPEIQDEVATLTSSVRARAGLGDEQLDRAAAADAEKAIAAYERENCTA